MANFPTSLDDGTSLPNPAAGNTQNNPDHATQHATANDAIKAIEAKVGTGASTPTANTLMFGTGTGTSAWTAVTSSQLRSTISDETGTGSAVFATTPTLVTPKVDTINENTPANGVTIDSLNIKDGALNTNNSVVTANITNAAVTPAKLANLDWYKSIPGVSFSSTIAGTWSRVSSAGTTFTINGGAQSAGAQNEEVQYKAVLQAGTYTIVLYNDKDVNRGIYTISVDGVSQGTVDGYAATRVAGVYTTVTTAYVLATSALISVNLKMATKNAGSAGYYGNVFSIEFIRTS